MDYAAQWVLLFLNLITTSFKNIFALVILDLGTYQITLGQTFLYFAMAAIMISFVFKVRVSSRIFDSVSNSRFERGRRIGQYQGFWKGVNAVENQNKN